MESEFNEFQYGYSVTSELERAFGPYLLSPPEIPSLIEEGRGSGYDVKFDMMGCPVFLQFKLAHYLTRRNAKQWSHYNSPYFRFKIYPPKISDQHNALVTLSLAETYVFYCSPRFYTRYDYVDYHMANTICKNSKMTSCHKLPFIGYHNEHCICYDQNGKNTTFFSEEKKIPDDKNLIQIIQKISKDKKRSVTIDENFPLMLIDKIKNTIEKLEEIDTTDRNIDKKHEIYDYYLKKVYEIQSPWTRLSFLTNAVLGAVWYIIITKQPK
jgi:hypothetical protein